MSQSTYLFQCNQFASDRQPHRAELISGPLCLDQGRHCNAETVEQNKERKLVAQRALRRVQQRLQGSQDGICRLLGDAHNPSLYRVPVGVLRRPCEPRLARFGIGTGVERDGACQVGCVQVGYKRRDDCAVKTVRALDALQDLVERKRLGLASLGGAPHRPARCRAHFAIVLATRVDPHVTEERRRHAGAGSPRSELAFGGALQVLLFRYSSAQITLVCAPLRSFGRCPPRDARGPTLRVSGSGFPIS